ncbi:MAG: 6,7-dimethyl-8-ribityllumazine synthase [Alphaproteobacteria bacterium]|nr:6,7-dimethyl-8-ribityllumazine synthase [Alphaproteobacteria bacterium]
MAKRPHILIVEARYYEAIADEMARGAVATLEAAGAAFERITVPGAFEIPAAVQMAVQTGSYDGYVALGCVIRGETTHYDYVCGESARGLQDLAIRHAIAIGYGILTVENEAQAWDRARVDRQDKGGGAARVCLDMLSLRQRFNLDPR